MKVLVLGDGLLGKELVSQTGWDCISRKKDGFDITNPSTFNLILETFDGIAQTCSYDVIINCIANTDTYATEKQNHWDVNYRGAADLVDFCNQWKIKLIHISSDSVYANCPTPQPEEGIPQHLGTYYSYTKLLADGYVELKSSNYLLIKGTHKPTPFPFPGGWIDQVGNFDYVDIIASIIIKLITNNAQGIYNVGTTLKTMYDLAKQTNPDVIPIKKQSQSIPSDVSMNIDKLNKFLDNL